MVLCQPGGDDLLRKGIVVMLVFICLNIFELVFWTSSWAVPAYWKLQTHNYDTDSDNLRVAPQVTSKQREQASQALNTYVPLLDEYFGQTVQLPLVVLVEEEQLQGRLEAAGAYQRGVILLAVGTGSDFEQTLVHELAHHYVDAMARGNYPVWYSEGIAQLLEQKLFARVWFDAIKDKDYYKYSITEFKREFYNLDQVSAYRQALTMVAAIEELGKGQANQLILYELGRGKTFAQALEDGIGMELVDLHDLSLN